VWSAAPAEETAAEDFAEPEPEHLEAGAFIEAEPFAAEVLAEQPEPVAHEPVEREAVDTGAFAPPEELVGTSLAAPVPGTEFAPTPWQPPGVLEGGVVLTETIAELYTAQGLYGRAADVYRSLLAERPDDARLAERLRASEAALEGAAEADESAGWLEGVESAWTGGGGVAGAGPTPYAWTDIAQAEDAGGGARIADWFRDLLAWRPAGDPTAAEDVAAYEGAAAAQGADLAEEGSADGAGADDSAARAASAGEDGTTEEDEDLEMFRSWLQSLKK
jgi:hypothetical protein